MKCKIYNLKQWKQRKKSLNLSLLDLKCLLHVQFAFSLSLRNDLAEICFRLYFSLALPRTACAFVSDVSVPRRKLKRTKNLGDLCFSTMNSWWLHGWPRGYLVFVVAIPKGFWVICTFATLTIDRKQDLKQTWISGLPRFRVCTGCRRPQSNAGLHTFDIVDR